MTRFILFIRLLFQQYRSWVFYGIHCPPNHLPSEDIRIVYRLAYIIDNELLKHYTPYKGNQTEIITAFRSVPETLSWLASFTDLMRENKPIGEPLTLLTNARQLTGNIDDYLINDSGGSVDPSEAHALILTHLEALLEVYLTAPEERNKSHYDRRIRLLFPNITNILEGLRQVALKV